MEKPGFPFPNRYWRRRAPQQGCGSTGSPQVGKPGFPMSQPPLGAAGDPAGRGAVRQAHRRWGNPVSPVPNRRWGWLATQPAGARFDRLTAGGATRFPHVPTAVGGGWRSHRQGRGSTGSPQVGKPAFPVFSPQTPIRNAVNQAARVGLSPGRSGSAATPLG